MAQELKYHTIDSISTLNKAIIEEARREKVNTRDVHELVWPSWVKDALSKTEEKNGDVYAKAAVLLYNLICRHAFSGANKRTGFLATKAFIIENGFEFPVIDKPNQNSSTLVAIREGFYTQEHLEEWLRTGKIHERKR